jgi:hypothetical protein
MSLSLVDLYGFAGVLKQNPQTLPPFAVLRMALSVSDAACPLIIAPLCFRA